MQSRKRGFTTAQLTADEVTASYRAGVIHYTAEIGVEQVPGTVPGAARSIKGKPPGPPAASATENPPRNQPDKPGVPPAAPPRAQANTPALPNEIPNSIGMKLVLIPAGEFLMGSPDDDRTAIRVEKPQHRVRITRPFYLGVHEVTQAQYEKVMGNNPSWFSAHGGRRAELAGESTDQNPVENVAWLDAVKFCNNLSEREGLKSFYEFDGQTARVPDWRGPGYRLPTEAEWEYACRAKSTTPYSFGGIQRG